jgi:4-alpha-glucanotransferase
MSSELDGSISLGLLLHNHQPVGNFPWVFQQIYEEAYLPMLEALERHEKVRLSLHYTGSLLDWLTEAHPEFIARLAILVRRKQIELVGGGYYEPILCAIPDRDKIGQIRRLTEQLQKNFGITPTGMWMAERVWEPGLPSILREAGIEWTILDDIHFKSAGLDDDDLYGYYATEDQSSVLKVYATSKMLRYTIPWRPVEETIKALRSLATRDGKRILVMGDDGEKFGSWPDTHIYSWGTDGRSGWVEAFFTALEANSSWLHTVPPGEYAQTNPALGRAYIPTSSYIEMTEWALPARKSYQFSNLLHQLEEKKQYDILQFMRGGFWRNFLARYHEINNQHKKMLRVHELVYAANAIEQTALLDLWKAQANDTYWHGLFGGIYMAHVRSAIYHHLIMAQNAADRTRYGERHWQHYEWSDFDRDTQDELLIESDQQNVYIDIQRGGTLFEWDIRRSAHNMSGVMTRHEESYHQVLRAYEQERRRKGDTHEQAPDVQKDNSEPGSPHTTIRTKEANLDQLLVLDHYRRYSLIDHFLPAGLPLTDFAQARFEDQGNFVEMPYQASVEEDARGLCVRLERNGQVRRVGALSPLPIRLNKMLSLPIGEEKLLVRYSIENKGQARLQATFASEWNMHLLGGGKNEQAYYHIAGHELADSHFDSTGEVSAVHELHIGNSHLRQDMAFILSQEATLWRFSIDTITGSEAGFERTHQGSCLTFLWPLVLEAGEIWHVEIACTGRDVIANHFPS